MCQQVYKAEHKGQPVALKIFKKGQESINGLTAADIQRQLREVQMLQGCQSSHIVRFVGLLVFQGCGAVVTEFMSGGDLWTALHNDEVAPLSSR